MDEGTGLEGLIMGTNTENQESDEQFVERMAAASAKLQMVIKQEKNAHGFDVRLAGIIQGLNPQQIALVAFLLNTGISSLTILGFLSLENESAYGICYTTIHEHIEEKADFLSLRLHDGNVLEHLALWITFIFAAEHISHDKKFVDYAGKKEFVDTIYNTMLHMGTSYVRRTVGEDYESTMLQERLSHYHHQLFQLSDA